MKKLIVITEDKKKNFWLETAKMLFSSKSVDCYSGIEVEKIVELEKADFVLIDVIEPVNGIDLMSMLRHIDGNIRLRVSIFRIGFPALKFFHNRHLSHSPTLKEAAK